MSHITRSSARILWFVLTCAMSPSALAFFSDDEARKAILELRTTVETQHQEIQALQTQLKSIAAGQRGQFEVANQLEQLRQDNAKLRGQLEALNHDLATVQRQQKDLFTDLESRVAALEPKMVSVDGQDVRVEQKETLAYEAAQRLFKNGEFKASLDALSTFQKTYPNSVYVASAQYWLGNAAYALRDYKQAIAYQQTLIKNYPDSPKVPDALLNIASCQLELADKKAAQKTLETILTQYPKTSAAIAAKERLSHLK